MNRNPENIFLSKEQIERIKNQESSYSIGIDVGKASLAVGIVERYESNEGKKYSIFPPIIRLFSAPEKQNKSLLKTRGETRRQRNSKKHRAKRKNIFAKIVFSNGFIDKKDFDNWKNSSKNNIKIAKSKMNRKQSIILNEYLNSVKMDLLELRYRSLDEKISDFAMLKILSYFLNHRQLGYDTTTLLSEDEAKKNKSEKEYLEKLNYSSVLLTKYRTIGEALFLKNKPIQERNMQMDFVPHRAKNPISNNGSEDRISILTERSKLIEEVNLIFESQKEKGNSIASSTVFKEKYLELLREDFSSPRYDLSALDCPISSTENKKTKVASKAEFFSELYIVIEKLHNLRYTFSSNKNKKQQFQKLTKGEILKILAKLFKIKSKKLDINATFRAIGYSAKEVNDLLIIKGEKGDNGSEDFIKMPIYGKIMNTTLNACLLLPEGKTEIDVILYPEDYPEAQLFLTRVYTNIVKGIVNVSDSKKTKTIIKKELWRAQKKKMIVFPENSTSLSSFIDAASFRLAQYGGKGFVGRMSYSSSVIKKMTALMLKSKSETNKETEIEELITPYEAKNIISKLYNSTEKNKVLEKLIPEIKYLDFYKSISTNHTVVRSLSQVRLVLNELLTQIRNESGDKKWTFDTVTIEMIRDKQDDKRKKEHEKYIKEREVERLEAEKEMSELGIDRYTDNDLEKLILYKRQNRFDLYEYAKLKIAGENIGGAILDKNRLWEAGYCEIDHTLPKSRSLDNSFDNKTLVFRKTNQDKKNATPYEYLRSSEFKLLRSELTAKETRRNTTLPFHNLGYQRIRKIINIDFQGVDGFKNRDINDTAIIAKYTGKMIEESLLFHENKAFTGVRRIFANNGKITSILRRTWGISSKDRGDSSHHGEDAILISFSTPEIVKRISSFTYLHSLLKLRQAKEIDLKYIEEAISLSKIGNKYQMIEKFKKEVSTLNLGLENGKKISLSPDKGNLIKKIGEALYWAIAEASYPYKGFKEDFENAIESSFITTRVNIKKSGQLHDQKIGEYTTLKKRKKGKTGDENCIHGGIIKKDGVYIRVDFFLCVNNKTGNKEVKGVKISSLYCGLDLKKYPVPKIRGYSLDTFLFSVYENDLIEIVEKNTEGKIITSKGIFWKISGENTILLKGYEKDTSESYRNLDKGKLSLKAYFPLEEKNKNKLSKIFTKTFLMNKLIKTKISDNKNTTLEMTLNKLGGTTINNLESLLLAKITYAKRKYEEDIKVYCMELLSNEKKRAEDNLKRADIDKEREAEYLEEMSILGKNIEWLKEIDFEVDLYVTEGKHYLHKELRKNLIKNKVSKKKHTEYMIAEKILISIQLDLVSKQEASFSLVNKEVYSVKKIVQNTLGQENFYIEKEERKAIPLMGGSKHEL